MEDNKQYQLQIFETEEHEQIRIMQIDGEPWFVGVDVCNALGLKNPSDAYSQLDEDDLGTAEGVDSRGRKQQLRIVSEPGLYALIFQSRKAGAKRFKKWVISEVIPSIRKTGGYGQGATPVPADWKPFHDRITLNWGAVPDGYFSVFKELADLIGTMVSNGIEANDKLIPDISVGKLWSTYWDERALSEDYGDRVSYMHSYPSYFPQAKSNPQQAWAYPDEALATYRRWVKNVYIPTHFPQYLNRLVKDGRLQIAYTNAVLTAVGVLKPKPQVPQLPKR